MGGLLGCLGAKILFTGVDLSKMSYGFLRTFQVEPSTLALGISVALIVGVVSGGIPALHVTRLTVSEGLRRIG